jgi:hypothetical protein
MWVTSASSLIEGLGQACPDFGTAHAHVQRFTATGPEVAMYRPNLSRNLKAFAASQEQESP